MKKLYIILIGVISLIIFFGLIFLGIFIALKIRRDRLLKINDFLPTNASEIEQETICLNSQPITGNWDSTYKDPEQKEYDKNIREIKNLEKKINDKEIILGKLSYERRTTNIVDFYKEDDKLTQEESVKSASILFKKFNDDIDLKIEELEKEIKKIKEDLESKEKNNNKLWEEIKARYFVYLLFKK